MDTAAPVHGERREENRRGLPDFHLVKTSDWR